MSCDVEIPPEPPAVRERRIFTGLLDRDRKAIFYGDRLRTGMRRNDTSGWTTEIVRRGDDGLPYLVDSHGDGMQMQWDQELRELVQ